MFLRKYLRPFWFARNCETIKVPYVYGSVIFSLLVISFVLFMVMAWKNYPAATLGAMTGVIATLSGLYGGVIALYNSGKDKPDNLPPGHSGR